MPGELFEAFRHVADALSSGIGVTVAPMIATLTTQEAADFLGIARPTLVRILEWGEISMEKPGRQRFVRLQDLVVYRAVRREQTSGGLEQMVADAEDERLTTGATVRHRLPGER